MEQLELEFGGKRKEFECTGAKVIMMDDVDMWADNEDVNEVLEHTILDKLLEEWVEDDDLVLDEVGAENDCGRSNKTENECAEPDVDECVQTAQCVGECKTYLTLSMWCKGNCDGHCKVVEHGKSE